MRLIDADALYDALADKLLWLMNYGDETYLSVGNDIRNTIDAQPTAYDVENVVEQLEETKIKDTGTALDEAQKERCFWYAQGMNRAIEIVKGGGADA